MQLARLLVLLLVSLAGHAAAEEHPVAKVVAQQEKTLLLKQGSTVVSAGEHPVAKVITLLQNLMEQVKSEGQTEEVSYQKFLYWCKTSSSELSDAIKEEKDAIDALQSSVEGKTKEIEMAKADISKLETEILNLQSSDKEASDDDKARSDLYKQKEGDLKSTISAIDDAVKALVEAGTTTDSKLLLSQHKVAQNRVRDILALVATVASEGEQDTLMTFAQSTEDSKQAPGSGDYGKHVNKYSFKSNSVTELLKNLKLKFEDDLIEATKAETNAANSFSLSKNARTAAATAAENSKKQKETDLGESEGDLSTAQKSLEDQQADLKADTGALDTTKASCSTKKTEWDERTTIRANELLAMKEGVKILAKISGVRTEAPSNPVLPSSPTALIHIKKKASSLLQFGTDPQKRAVQLLRATATTYHSKALERLAMQLASHVPKQFQDVVNSIQKMIFRLKQEQTDEDNHKAWCDMEVSKTSASLDNKGDKINELNAKIKDDTAMVASLTSEIQAATQMAADIKKFQGEATEIRRAGKEENAVAIQDAAAAQKGIANAVSVLLTFYKSTGQIAKEPWEFLQEPVKLGNNPTTWSAGYTGVTDPSKAGEGVIAVLEAVSSDFSKMEANTKAQEVADQKEFEDTMKKNSIELARRSKESEMKDAQKKRLLDKVTDLSAQKKHVSAEVESTEQYNKDLQKACVDGDSTYENRKTARDAEIKALGEAQQLLDTAFEKKASFLQRSGRPL